jgi:anthranilate synthase/aminodeoxychorismate synthase-like glutamine amidotransferase
VILLLDNYDSFTYNLSDYFARLGVQCRVVRNDVPWQEIIGHTYKGIVLSPGPGTPQEAGRLMQVIDYYHNKLPMLGICLGHQAIGQYFGASLHKAIKPMHGKISEIQLMPDLLHEQLPAQIEVVRYHSLVLKELPECLVATSFTKDAEVMSLAHRTLPVRGIQYHPEAALTRDGLRILNNWVKFQKRVD